MISQIFPRELDRLQYLLRIFMYFALVFLITSALLPAIVGSKIDVKMASSIFLALQIPKVFLLDLPRIRHIGRSPLLLILVLIPYLGGVFQILLLVLPPDRPPTSYY